ncbi:hypothetical protein BDZ94DRAFT_1275943 [Collybia nuda]|uniref:Uncharacterized protein n=1 Tax=Collybia nuda TaxID=64659 RepID=A0A9P5XV83_9AGAR|nr:hypothetical protein BDZ94DRAFT_1275943 [Collybia nuda]
MDPEVGPFLFCFFYISSFINTLLPVIPRQHFSSPSTFLFVHYPFIFHSSFLRHIKSFPPFDLYLN